MMTLGTAAKLNSVAAVTAVDVVGSFLPVKSEMKSLGVIIDHYASTSTPLPSPRRVTITYTLCATRDIC